MDKARLPTARHTQSPNVYEPSEDSFLLLDALEAELSYIKQLRPNCLVEIGSGSGIIVTSLACVLPGCSFFSTDLNFDSCRSTQSTACLNHVVVNPICMNLLEHFKDGVIDIAIFNPPYVVTESVEVQGDGINRAWAGGLDGREVIDKLLPQIGHKLSARGVLYLLLLKENKPDEVIEIMNTFGFQHKIIKERKIQGEYLYIVRFTKCS